jgi:hypothetical protein
MTHLIINSDRPAIHLDGITQLQRDLPAIRSEVVAKGI